jgi:hypothetical protein
MCQAQITSPGCRGSSPFGDYQRHRWLFHCRHARRLAKYRIHGCFGQSPGRHNRPHSRFVDFGERDVTLLMEAICSDERRRLLAGSFHTSSGRFGVQTKPRHCV